MKRSWDWCVTPIVWSLLGVHFGLWLRSKVIWCINLPGWKCFCELKVKKWKCTLVFHNSQWERYICLMSSFLQDVGPSEFITLCWYRWTLVLWHKLTSKLKFSFGASWTIQVVQVESWFSLPQLIQVASCSLFDLVSVVFNHYNYTNSFKKTKKSCFCFGRFYDRRCSKKHFNLQSCKPIWN